MLAATDSYNNSLSHTTINTEDAASFRSKNIADSTRIRLSTAIKKLLVSLWPAAMFGWLWQTWKAMRSLCLTTILAPPKDSHTPTRPRLNNLSTTLLVNYTRRILDQDQVGREALTAPCELKAISAVQLRVMPETGTEIETAPPYPHQLSLSLNQALILWIFLLSKLEPDFGFGATQRTGISAHGFP
ncbi:hypothetical protein QBC38DRAFT_455662 [Podospora fimiseda]|uniref:Uncharacterized protein n=1 Tax=Podospora fimiseda TaxID=252190 RepID=A0AAN7GY51_9PEZI|nr:hypothetical protein QBC38DRAFT_455662 [Podospora fimiseda]